MRTLVLGDIHGAYQALLQVLQRAAVTPEDRLIFLGDYCDGWHQVPQVIQHIIDLPNPKITILGNHDKWTLEWMERGKLLERPEEMHFEQGGEATYTAYNNITMEAINQNRWQAHRQFLRGCQLYFIDEDNRLFVHGGIMRGVGMDADHVYYWDRRLWDMARFSSIAGDHLPHPYAMHKEVFIGHTAIEGLPQQRMNVTNMDTGCGWFGRLSIMDVDTREVWQSDPVQELYPGLRGRW